MEQNIYIVSFRPDYYQGRSLQLITWNSSNVKDINSVLQVTVYDEDRDHRFEFLGAVAIPLLRIENGQKRWYALKERKLRSRAKGQNPQILLELNVVWNEVRFKWLKTIKFNKPKIQKKFFKIIQQIRATIQTLQPKEKKYIEPELKFNRHTFVRNVMRVKAVVMDVIEIGKYIESVHSQFFPFLRLEISLLGCADLFSLRLIF